ncbi:MAG: hypothetical protein WBG27_05830 [Candidatus Aquilonibacter sp.]
MILPTSSSNRPVVRTTIDLQLERPDRRPSDLFQGWGVSFWSGRLF